MNRFLTIIFLLILFTSCSKESELKDDGSNTIKISISEIKYKEVEVEKFKYVDEYSIPTDFKSPMKNYGISDKFGFRTSPITEGPMGEFNIHKGIDLVGPKNSEIMSVKDGVVVEHFPPPGTKTKRGTLFKGHPIYGGLIVIDHGKGLYTLYAHMKNTYVWKGMKVKQGQVIGIQGRTGEATGDHLHFELMIDPMYAIDPNFLKGQEP